MDHHTLKKLYESMAEIRCVEETVAEEYAKQEMRCPVHLSIGQEAVPVGICAHLSADDKVYSNHRCHAHYLAKGGSIPRMVAELYGRSTGCAKGKGGSMHLVDVANGMMGSSALVGGTISIAVGAAFSNKLSGRKTVAVGFFGDGGSEEGVLYESLNFASLHKLPIIFACENNNYATYSPQKARQATLKIHSRGETFGVASEKVDGNDVIAVYEAAERAVGRARKGEGPTLIEFVTMRWRDHVGPNFDDQVGYRTRSEIDAWIAKCPIARARERLLSEKALTEESVAEFQRHLQREVHEAFEFAQNSPFPKAEEVYTDVYA